MLLRKWRNYERGCIPAPFLQSLTPTSRAFVKHFYSVFRKSDAKIEITIMRQILSELNILSAALIITFLVQTLQISTKSTAQFLSNSCLKIELKNRNFQYGKVAIAVRTQYHQLQFVLKVVAICTDMCMSPQCSPGRGNGSGVVCARSGDSCTFCISQDTQSHASRKINDFRSFCSNYIGVRVPIIQYKKFDTESQMNNSYKICS